MDLERLLLEKRRREGFLGYAFSAQKAVINSPAKRKCGVLPRRSGKTFAYILNVAQKYKDFPGDKFYYVALTRPSAENIAWPILKQLKRDFDLDWHFQEAKLRVTFENDAQLVLIGADQNEWMERCRGVRMAGAGIDEAAFYRVNLAKFVEEILDPALRDLSDRPGGGELWMYGTPGDVCSGYFYDVSTGKVPGWEQYRWTPFDNPHMEKQIRAAIEEKKKLNPNIEKDPGFRREYLGEWVEDDKGLVYSIGELITSYEPDPDTDSFVLAIDFGFKEDCTSFTVGRYSTADPDFVILESWKQEKMLVPDIAEQISTTQLKYPGVYIIGDPASAQLMEELRQRFSVPIFDAEKTDKYSWIRLYNSDVATGRVKILKPTCEDLIKEQKRLVKLIKYNNQWREHPKMPNDCCDSNLYAYRHCYHYRYAPPDYEPPPGSPEAIEKQMDDYWIEEAERAEERAGKRRFI